MRGLPDCPPPIRTFPTTRRWPPQFDAYVDHLGLRDRIVFETSVEHAERARDGTWTIALAPGRVHPPENDLPLFRRVLKPGIDNLFFIALLQPLGATMPIAEAQGRWIASYLRGEYHLPSRGAMEADMRREGAAMFKRYVTSARHTMEVDFDTYPYRLAPRPLAGADL